MASVNEPTTREWLLSLLEPGMLLAWAMSYYAKTSLAAVFQRGQILAPLLETRRLRDEAFGKFWVEFSSNREESMESAQPPPNQPPSPPSTEVQNSTDLIPPVLAQASGLVLDVGPGTGTQMPLLRSPAIKAIYGAEPCQGLHEELRARAVANGLGEKYFVLPCSVEGSELTHALEKHGLNRTNEGLFDTIVCVRVLCSLPNMQQSVNELYALLRPGGKLLITEHVVNPWRTSKGSVVARAMQALYGALGWSFYIGDCCLNRDTEKVLRAAGEWESVELDRWFGRTVFPYISGVLVKKA
ncbi:class I SAM-dependent methyltransferase [Aspergillus affinis]|uniref:class I SAM-dependent methyltransferase n=1 Tax=Aspergillus affinis TaxID=1070780 RepID=UPI0022FE6E31|nr:S-adenosyl-L-methionine-dependent methyltransferase [Aspergillus affinis]KAI9036502.1 S-adenosyl-L-methionine-dependent methyltransferase [Aspergillus affinis]